MLVSVAKMDNIIHWWKLWSSCCRSTICRNKSQL